MLGGGSFGLTVKNTKVHLLVALSSVLATTWKSGSLSAYIEVSALTEQSRIDNLIDPARTGMLVATEVRGLRTFKNRYVGRSDSRFKIFGTPVEIFRPVGNIALLLCQSLSGDPFRTLPEKQELEKRTFQEAAYSKIFLETAADFKDSTVIFVKLVISNLVREVEETATFLRTKDLRVPSIYLLKEDGSIVRYSAPELNKELLTDFFTSHLKAQKGSPVAAGSQSILNK